eukprot:scaffold293343_cov17-Tisochrysis_lutea.AAC.1
MYKRHAFRSFPEVGYCAVSLDMLFTLLHLATSLQLSFEKYVMSTKGSDNRRTPDQGQVICQFDRVGSPKVQQISRCNDLLNRTFAWRGGGGQRYHLAPDVFSHLSSLTPCA